MGVAHSNDPGLVFLDTILSEKKIVKEKFFFHLFISTRYNSPPIAQILIKKIWACRARRALSNGPVGFPRCYTVGEKNYAILSEKKIVKEKFFFHLFPLNLYNSAPIGQILIKKIWACRARRALSNYPGQFRRKNVYRKIFFPLFPLNSYNSVPIGQILMKKIWACRRRRALSNECGPALPGAILSEKKIVKGKFFFPLFLLNRYNTAPVGQILIKKIWACSARIALSNDSGPAFPGAILSEKKIVKGKFFFPLFPLNSYNSAPIGQILK
ncbi:hypothetical protein V1477_017763 [Vespula maculifrons]|uniref:Uncharacterized protein n=1 Tax=Vespula maculifrons TaxID=7453 RepID=A0ABD2B0D0_VESMC